MAEEHAAVESALARRRILKFLKWVAALVIAIGAIAAATFKAVNMIQTAGDHGAARVANVQAIVGEIRA